MATLAGGANDRADLGTVEAAVDAVFEIFELVVNEASFGIADADDDDAAGGGGHQLAESRV